MNYLAGVLLGLVFLVESFVWFIRSMSAAEYRSKSISTSNIIMYITRVMLIGYQILLNYKIETGGGVEEVIVSGMIAMLVALLCHALFFCHAGSLRFSWRVFKGFALTFRLIRPGELCDDVYVSPWRFRPGVIMLASLVSTVTLLFVYTLPQIFATIFYDYRLTLSSVGQVISFFGMLITLFVLDPRLFRMHDTGEIRTGFSQYLNGRMWGLVSAGLLLTLAYGFV
jgi:hypothetical protein